MSWLLTILVGILTAVVCGAAACYLATLCVEWYRISSFEGGSGYFVAFITLFGLILGLILGLVISRLVVPPTFLAGLGYSVGTVAVLFCVVALFCRWDGDVPPKIGGEKLDLEVELRCPRGVAPEIRENNRYNLCSMDALGAGNQRRSSSGGEVLYKQATETDGQWTVPCRVRLFSDRSKRIVRVIVNESNDIQILLPMAGSPGKEQMTWSAWRDDHILQEKDKTYAGYSYRFRVRRQSEVRREVSKELEEAQALRDREFAALSEDAPLDEWLKFAMGDDGKRDRVTEVLAARIGEVPALIPDADSERLRVLTTTLCGIQTLPAAAAVPLKQTGQALVARLRSFDMPKNDRATEMAGQLRSLYWAWHELTGKVEGHRPAEFRPILEELQKIAMARHDENYEFAALADALKTDLEQPEAEPQNSSHE